MGQASQKDYLRLPTRLVNLKIALVYDRVNKFGGAERVLTYLHNLFPDAPIYTLVHSPKEARWARGIRVIPSFFQIFPFFRTRHELLAPLAPLAFESHDMSDFDLVISVTSADAKSVLVKPGTLHLCYCLTPTRYLWHLSEYQTDWKMKIFPKFLQRLLKYIDFIAAARVDYMIAISREVQKRIHLYYRRPSSLVYPPVEDKFFSKSVLGANRGGYYLVVSRLIPYKKVDLVIATFNKLGLPLKIVGQGSQKKRLENMARGNIEFIADSTDSTLIDLYRRAKATIFPQEEDFGLVPLESMACGTPVIAYKKGGALETIVSGKTGVFFAHQSIRSLTKAIIDLESINIDPHDCRTQASNFSEQKFYKSFLDTVSDLYRPGQF
jgi:glycosyltransferase involved in cell wall biosynthesis